MPARERRNAWHGVRRVLRQDRRDVGGRGRVAEDPVTAPERHEGGCCWAIEPVVADGVVLVPAHLYGMQLDPLERRMFVYNPVPAVRSDPAREVLEPEPFPPTERDGDLMRMHVVFPDGSQATIVYPILSGSS